MQRAQWALVAAILSDDACRSDLRCTGSEALASARLFASNAALRRVALPLLSAATLHHRWTAMRQRLD